jgi:hypothetical protein
MNPGDDNASRRIEIERLVRQVLAETAGYGQRATATINHPHANEWSVTNKVISLEVLREMPAGVSRLVAPRGALLTPAARDDLRRRNIAIASAVTPSQRPETSLTLAVADTAFDPAPLISMLRGEIGTLDRLPTAPLIETVDALCDRIRRQAKGLLLTDAPATALCVANRQQGIRAIEGTNAQSTADAAKAVAANLLVLAPAGRGSFELRQTVRAWIRAASAKCPHELRSRLD